MLVRSDLSFAQEHGAAVRDGWLNKMNIAGVDLNLLIAFDALMEHRHVTRAAQAIGLSQPAMSNALSRLRILFADRLLVRSSLGMNPTPRALDAHGAIREALRSIDGVLSRVERFDPMHDARRFRVAFAEDAAFYILPNMTQHIATSAGIAIDVLSTAHLAGVELVLSGEAEASVGLVPKKLAKELRFQKLFQERIVAIGRRGHPAFRGNRRRLTLEDFLSYPHVAVRPSATSRTRVDEALARIGKRRRVSLNVPHFMVAPYLVSGTDMIACVAERVAKRFARGLDLVMAESPVGGEPYDACLLWHRRFDQDSGHQWLRQSIIVEAKTLGSAAERRVGMKYRARG
jgi:DNA-binding transcriptional LysR family regulator